MARMRLLGLFLLTMATTSTAQGAIISYDFSGTFSQPVDGSTKFSGTFSYDSNVPLNPSATQDPSHAYYSDAATGDYGKDINISFKIGDTPSSTLGTIVNDTLTITHNSAYDSLNLDVSFRDASGKNLSVVVGLLNDNSVSPGPFTSLAPPTTLSLPSFNFGTEFVYNSFPTDPGPADIVVGTITSLFSTGSSNVPEPSTLAVLLIGFGGMGVRSYRRRRNPLNRF